MAYTPFQGCMNTGCIQTSDTGMYPKGSTGNEAGAVLPQAKKRVLSAVVRVPWKGVYGGSAGFEAIR